MGAPSKYVNGACPHCHRPERVVPVPQRYYHALTFLARIVAGMVEPSTLRYDRRSDLDPMRRGIRHTERLSRVERIIALLRADVLVPRRKLPHDPDCIVCREPITKRHKFVKLARGLAHRNCDVPTARSTRAKARSR